MTGNNPKEQVHYLKDVQGLSFRQIALKIGISRQKASKLYSGNSLNHVPKDLKLNPYQDLIRSWLDETPSLKAKQIFKRLKERGIQISYRTTARYTKPLRKKKKGSVYWPLTFLPGEEGQVDWFFLNHPKLGKLAGFVLILSYSRYAFAQLFYRYSFEFFIQGHLNAFDHFKGCPHALRFDNLSSVVLSRSPLTYNSSFLEFARHYGFEIRLCNPASGNEKGRVERLIRSIREMFVNTASHHQTLRGLNHALEIWIQEKNTTLHRATDAIPVDKKLEETLKPLPDQPWTNVRIHPPKRPTKTGFLFFDTNLYSVPEYKAHELLSIRAFVEHIEIFDVKGHRVATHPRSFERHQHILNPLHRSGKRLSDKAKRERIFSVIQHMDPAMGIFLEQNRLAGEDPYQTSYVLFKLLRHHSRGLILSLIRQAITQKTCRLKFVLTHLQPPQPIADPVSPQNPALLTLDYQPRSLEDYDDHK